MVANAAGIPTIVPMDEHGRYTADVPDWVGEQVFDANPHVIRHLKEHRYVLRHETYNHSYPHCWRCSKPLVYRAISSWFVAVTKFRDRMVELNEQINWVPGHVKHGSFGKWLENARDWSISRNRFWGSPIPVWRSDDPRYQRTDVYGSIEQLESDFGVKVDDLHRPAIDELTRPNPDDPTGRSTMRRVPEVLDCWFESGSMPFAQVHYPFENAGWFESHYPGDFIVEYIGQSRGWFYTLHVLATALFDRPAFLTCVSHGIVLGDDGLKMSKSLRNYPDPMEVFDRHGADAMRWYLLSSPILRGNDFSVTAAGLRDTARVVLLPLWNAWYFLTLYANAAGVQGSVRDGVERPFSRNVLDRYIVAKSRDLVEDVTRAMDAYDLFGACNTVRSFVETLTNWYIRRSRQRFWDGEVDAIDTLHTVMDVLVRVAAPLLPYVTDEVHAGLHGDGRHPSRGASTSPTGRESRICLATRDWCARWTRCATCARPRCPCARPTGAGCASRSPTSPSLHRTLARSSRSSTSSPTRSTCARWSSRTTSMRWPASSYRSCRRRSAPASGPTPSTSSGRYEKGSGPPTATRSWPADTGWSRASSS